MKMYFVLRNEDGPLTYDYTDADDVTEFQEYVRRCQSPPEAFWRGCEFLSYCMQKDWDDMSGLSYSERNEINLKMGRTPAALMGTSTCAGVKSKPVICPEVWAQPREDVDYMAAIRDMCKGVS